MRITQLLLSVVLVLRSVKKKVNPMSFGLKKNWRIEGNKRYLKGDYHSAIKLYSKAIEEDSINCEAFFNRGMAYHDLSLFHQAIQDFSTAIKLNLRFSEAYKSRALSYYSLNDSKKALADYNTATLLAG